jgi:multisubunit Na+/H+ antiporter MnhE subunit
MAKWSQLGIAALVRAASLFGLWILLVDGTDEPNLITGGVCAVGAALLVTTVQSLKSEHARVRPSMLRRFYRPFLYLVTDTFRVTGALLARLVLRRDVRGEFRAARYRATGDSSDDVTRRLLTEWAASMAPNRYAIGIDRRRNVLIVHELVSASGPLDPLELG